MRNYPPDQERELRTKSTIGSVTYLEPALWQQLTEAENDQEYCLSWLRLQCRIIDNVHGGIVMLGPANAGPFTPVAAWPEQLANKNPFNHIAQRVLMERRGVVVRYAAEIQGQTPDRFHVGFPVILEGRLHGMAIIDVAYREAEELQSVMRQLQWGCSWLENRILRLEKAPVEEAELQLSTAFDLTAQALQQVKFSAAALTFVTELANRLLCDRVSLGLVRKQATEIVAVSHSAQFGKQMNLLRAVAQAMDESIDQRTTLVYPPPEAYEKTITRAHHSLAVNHGTVAVLTIPLQKPAGGCWGGLTFERSSGPEFTTQEIDLCRAVAALLGPILEEKRLNDRSLASQALDVLRGYVERLRDPERVATKVVAAAVLITVVFLAFATGTYRVNAKTMVEGEVQRSITAPYDGYLDTSEVRAGDEVESGQLLARLDNRDLLLEHFKWRSQHEQFLLEYRKAMATGDTAASRIHLQKVNQAKAQLQLLDKQLERANIMAPFSGLLISGDLSQSLEAPVARGDVLFELAPLNRYRVVLEVDERDISSVEKQQAGELILNALPEQSIPFMVELVTPVSTPREGRNFFKVYARLQEMPEGLRPGMEGYGKVDAGQRNLVWIWTHELFDWISLQAWNWLP